MFDSVVEGYIFKCGVKFKLFPLSGKNYFANAKRRNTKISVDR